MYSKPIASLFLFFAALFARAVFAPCASAQESATLTGRVLDPSGAAVADAQVEVRNLQTNVVYPGASNAAGFYTIVGLPPGLYRITIEKTGFKTDVKSGISLHVQDIASINFSLQLGSASETITVEAGGAVINTTDASVSTVVDRQFAENLPLNGRSFQSLINLTPGVTLNTSSGTMGQFTVNGQRSGSNYWTVDGVSANTGTSGGYGPGIGIAGSVGSFNVLGGTNSMVSVDALQEFRIQTSTYAPEFGRTPGGQISIVTRSGTNQFHGSAFDYFRNSVLDASDWFANANSLPKAAEKQNDFGGVLGGAGNQRQNVFLLFLRGPSSPLAANVADDRSRSRHPAERHSGGAAIH